MPHRDFKGPDRITGKHFNSSDDDLQEHGGDRIYVEGNLTLNTWADKATGEAKTGLNVAAWRVDRLANIGRNRIRQPYEPDEAIAPPWRSSPPCPPISARHHGPTRVRCRATRFDYLRWFSRSAVCSCSRAEYRTPMTFSLLSVERGSRQAG